MKRERESETESVIGKGRLNSTNGEWVDAHNKFAGGDGRIQNKTEDELNESSWNEYVSWDDIKEASAKALLESETEVIAADVKEKYEQGAMLMWDNFYKSHEDKFFKDRTYLHLEYEDLNPFKVDRDGTAAFLQSRTPNKNTNNNNNNNNNNENKDNNTTTTTTTTTTEEGEKEIGMLNNEIVSIPKIPRNQKKIVLEAGCGVGNTIFPLVKLNPDKYFYAFDFSPSAIEIFKRNPEYTEDNKVCDPTSQEVPKNIVADNSVDIAVMVFFMSAVDPNKMGNVISNIYKTLKPGGIVLLRDYGMYDMTQMRFINKRGRKLGENFYMRADGTRTYFFSKESLESMFTQAGFNTSVVKYNTRELRNRKRKLSMYRVWISGRFVKPLTA